MPLDKVCHEGMVSATAYGFKAVDYRPDSEVTAFVCDQQRCCSAVAENLTKCSKCRI